MPLAYRTLISTWKMSFLSGPYTGRYEFLFINHICIAANLTLEYFWTVYIILPIYETMPWQLWRNSTLFANVSHVYWDCWIPFKDSKAIFIVSEEAWFKRPRGALWAEVICLLICGLICVLAVPTAGPEPSHKEIILVGRYLDLTYILI